MNTPTGPPRAVIYARISDDPSGETIGVRRQKQACLALVQARGWQLVEECSDNDISALHGQHRPGYQRVLAQVNAEAVDFVVVWQTSRLLRNRRERAAAIELFGEKRVGIIAVKGPDLDLSTAYGRGIAGMLGEFDTMESEVKSERVAAASAERARIGHPNGALGYGWSKTGTGRHAEFEEHPEQASIVREIVARLLRGESINGVMNDLNNRGIAAPNSKSWGKSSVRKIALRAANAAIRVHHRGRPTETRTAGIWPALIPEDEHRRIVALLDNPVRRTTKLARPGSRRYLLTYGLGECGVCSGPLSVKLRGHANYGTKSLLYLCTGYEHVGRSQQNVDNLVTTFVLQRLSQPDAIDWQLPDDDVSVQQAKELRDLKSRQDEAADRFADGMISMEQLERINARIQPQIDAIERLRWSSGPWIDGDVMKGIAGPTAEAVWTNLSIAQQRAVLEALGLRVIIDKVKRKGPGFDPRSVRVEIGVFPTAG